MKHSNVENKIQDFAQREVKEERRNSLDTGHTNLSAGCDPIRIHRHRVARFSHRLGSPRSRGRKEGSLFSRPPFLPLIYPVRLIRFPQLLIAIKAPTPAFAAVRITTRWPHLGDEDWNSQIFKSRILFFKLPNHPSIFLKHYFYLKNTIEFGWTI